MGTRHRVVIAFVSALIAVVGVVAATSAVGASAGRAAVESSTSSTTPTSVGIGGNYAFSSSVITGPGLTTPRHLNAYQSAVFVQSWLGDLYFGHPRHGPPPADLPVFRVDVTGIWGVNRATLAVFYSTDGTNVWIGFPRQQMTTASPRRPPAPGGWFQAQPRVREAFAGTAKLLLTGGVQAETSTTAAPTTTTTTAAASPSHHRSSRAVWLWLAAGLALVAAAGLVVSWFRDRVRKQ